MAARLLHSLLEILHNLLGLLGKRYNPFGDCGYARRNTLSRKEQQDRIYLVNSSWDRHVSSGDDGYLCRMACVGKEKTCSLKPNQEFPQGFSIDCQKFPSFSASGVCM